MWICVIHIFPPSQLSSLLWFTYMQDKSHTSHVLSRAAHTVQVIKRFLLLYRARANVTKQILLRQHTCVYMKIINPFHWSQHNERLPQIPLQRWLCTIHNLPSSIRKDATNSKYFAPCRLPILSNHRIQQPWCSPDALPIPYFALHKRLRGLLLKLFRYRKREMMLVPCLMVMVSTRHLKV